VGERTSRLRQRLRQAAEQHQDHIAGILDEDATLIRGSFGSRSRVCGNAGCHCAQGEKHTSKYLTATAGGKVRQVHVPASDEDRVAAGVARYRRFRRMRNSPVYNTAAATSGALVPGLRRESSTRPKSPASP